MEGSGAARDDRGHRTRAHTADVIIEAWGPTRETCLAEAVLAMVEAFAETGDLRAGARVPVRIDATDDEEVLVALLDEVVYLIDGHGEVPIGVTLEPSADGGVHGELTTVPASTVTVTGAPPKGISRSELFIGIDAGHWRCDAQIDV